MERVATVASAASKVLTSRAMGSGMSAVLHPTDSTSAVAGVNSRASDQSLRLWMILAAGVALALKLCLALNTVGTNDVASFYLFGHSIASRGLEQTYRDYIGFNHPPLIGYYLQLIYDLDHSSVLRANAVRFPFLLRLPGIIADFVVVLVLLKHRQQLAVPVWALFALALSPVSFMVSGFHGNTDPVMVMFLVLAAISCLQKTPLPCALFLGLACQIKIIPLLILPLFAAFWFQREQLVRFFFAFVLVSLIFWGEALLRFPLIVLRNVFSYSSIWGLWGISYWLRMTGWKQFGAITYYHFPMAEAVMVNALKLIIIFAVLLIAWRKRPADARALFASIGWAWIVFFVFSPGVGAQYLVWLAPFVLVLSATFFSYVLVSSSIFLFFFYNVITEGIPWYWGLSTAKLNSDWTPWGLWPWAVLVGGMILFCNGWRARIQRLFLGANGAPHVE